MADAATVSAGSGRLGRYRVVEEIGRGGTAAIFRGVLPGMAGFEKTVVLKRLHDHLVGDARYEQLFVNEARRAAAAQHPNLVQTFELERDSASRALFMVMEHVDGVDARQLIARLGAPVPTPVALYIVSEFLSGLQALSDRSERIVHSDVTPENVFLSRQGDVKLGDLGMSTAEDGHFEPFQGQVRGKVPYMSPEQTTASTLDARSDVFSAGIVLWELLTGRRLFHGRDAADIAARIRSGPRPSARALNADVPAALDALLQRTLAADPDARPATPGALRTAILEQLAALGAGYGPLKLRAWLGRLVRDVRRPARTSLDVGTSTSDIPPPSAVGVSPSSTLDSDESGSVLPPPSESGSSGSSSPPTPPMPGVAANVETHEIVQSSDGWDVRAPGFGRVWIRGGRTTWGPFSRAGAQTRIERLPAGALSRVELSPNGRDWTPLPEALRELGLSLVPETAALEGARFTAALASVSLVRLFGDLETRRLTGRLVLLAGAEHTPERRDLLVQDGHLVDVLANASAIEAALDAFEPDRTPRSRRARAESALQLPLQWTTGRAAFFDDPAVDGPGWRPLTWMLPRRVATACPEGLLRDRLARVSSRPLRRTDRFDAVVRRLGLIGSEARRAAALGEGGLLQTVAPSSAPFDLALAWTLLELGALA